MSANLRGDQGRLLAKACARTVSALAVLFLSACASSFPKAPPVPPKDYRGLVLKRHESAIDLRIPRGEMEISQLRASDQINNADWVACLKTDARGKPRLWAFFFDGETIAWVREALDVDQCYRQTYERLRPKAP